MIRRIFADQLTPVLAYRRLVAPDDRTAPSFLFESVEQDGGIGRHSILGVRPGLEVLATADRVRVLEHAGDDGTEERACDGEDPFDLVRRIRDEAIPVELVGDTTPPDAFQAGFVGFAGHDLEPCRDAVLDSIIRHLDEIGA